MNPPTIEKTKNFQFRLFEGGHIRGDIDANGIPNGQVEFIFDHGDGNATVYNGTMKDGKEDGKGDLLFYDHSSFRGLFHKGRAVSGTVTNPDGRVIYNGEYDIYETFVGKGTQYLPDGSVYVGDFKRGKKHGRGVMTYSNKDSYEGNWNEDRRDGDGVYYFANCTVRSISGRWRNDRPIARLFLKFDLPCEDSSSKFVGDFNDGVRHGSGVMTYVSGDSYSGEWVNGKREGFGELRFFANNTVFAVLSGKWANDKPVSPMALKVSGGQIDRMTHVVNETATAKVNETVGYKWKWVCDICNKAKFRTFTEAMDHEKTCTDSAGEVHMRA